MSRHLDTGTGENRRRLTEEEARNGDVPTPFTPEEWEKMHRATGCYAGPAGWERVFSGIFARLRQVAP